LARVARRSGGWQAKASARESGSKPGIHCSRQRTGQSEAVQTKPKGEGLRLQTLPLNKSQIVPVAFLLSCGFDLSADARLLAMSLGRAEGRAPDRHPAAQPTPAKPDQSYSRRQPAASAWSSDAEGKALGSEEKERLQRRSAPRPRACADAALLSATNWLAPKTKV
jgi:hypothetical protein